MENQTPQTPTTTQTPQPDVLPTGVGTEQTSPIPEPTKKTGLKFFIIGAVTVVVAFLFFPLPYYQNQEIICKLGQQNCPQTGWNFTKPLYQSFLDFLLQSNRSQTSLSTPNPSPTPDPTANWKTYHNELSDYEIKYPGSWKLVYQPARPEVLEIGDNDLVLLNLNETDQITISGIKLDKKESLEKMLQVRASTITGTTKRNGKVELRSNSNIRQYYLITNDFGKKSIVIPITNNPTRYIFIGSSVDSLYQYVDQILSTFKFLGSNSNKIYTGKHFSIDTSTWKLFSDSNQSPATLEVLETVSFEDGQARMNIQVGTDTFEKVLASQDGAVVGEVVIDGVTATKKSGYGGIAGSVYSVNIVASRNGKTYSIGFYTLDTQSISSYQTDFDQVLSTFKFTQ